MTEVERTMTDRCLNSSPKIGEVAAKPTEEYDLSLVLFEWSENQAREKS